MCHTFVAPAITESGVGLGHRSRTFHTPLLNQRMNMKTRRIPIPLLMLITALAACDSSSPKEDDFTVTYAPAFDATTLRSDVTNPYFPLPPGAVWEYEGETEDGTERVVVEVLSDTRQIAGAAARVVRDRVYLDGALIEDTFDWFAQDPAGNVWYLGEETAEYEDGEIVSTEGSWETGIDGAEAGVLMPAQPAVGQAYYQEFLEGEAEDRGRVVAVGESVTVPAGTYANCIETEDTTPLEPDVLEHKYYCPQVGTVLEVDLEDDARVELLSVEIP